jgi:hypothetical protein
MIYQIRKFAAHTKLIAKLPAQNFKLLPICGAGRRHFRRKSRQMHAFGDVSVTETAGSISILVNIAGVSRETLGRLDVLSKFVVRIAANASARQRPVIIRNFREDFDYGDHSQFSARRPYFVGVW